jgi:GTP cyclohydrolase I
VSRSPRRATKAAGPDRAGLEKAFEAFLKAARLPKGTKEVAGTARRAAKAWADEFLDGYRSTAVEALGELSPAPKTGGLVVVTGIDFTSVCPHHLLPYRGVAHLAYAPGARVAGFGRLATLLDVLGHRLVLQEALAEEVVEALLGVLGARGAAVVLDAEQPCLSMRGEKRSRSRTRAEACGGALGDEALVQIRAALSRAGAEGR